MYLNDPKYDNFIDCKDSLLNVCKFNIDGRGNKIYIADSVKIDNLSVGITGSDNCITIEKNIVVHNLSIHIGASHCKVHIGEKTTFEDTFISLGEDGNCCEIGNDCMFAMQTGILASDFHPIIDLESHKRINYTKNGVVVCDHVWVGLGALILKDIIIGNNSVIGARSLVTKGIPSHTLVVGNPAKIIKQNIDWHRDGFLFEKYPVVDMDTLCIEESNELECFLEETDEFGYIRGWAFVKDLETCDQKIFFEVTISENNQPKVYEAGIMPRGDVVAAFNDNRYLWSGFECQICEKVQSLKLIILNGNYQGYKILKHRK